MGMEGFGKHWTWAVDFTENEISEDLTFATNYQALSQSAPSERNKYLNVVSYLSKCDRSGCVCVFPSGESPGVWFLPFPIFKAINSACTFYLT
jgi:hypothetical protein